MKEYIQRIKIMLLPVTYSLDRFGILNWSVVTAMRLVEKDPIPENNAVTHVV